MVLGQFFCRFTGSAPQTHCARRPQLVSNKILEEEIFAGTNFRELAFDRENRENFCLAKISRYTVSSSPQVPECGLCRKPTLAVGVDAHNGSGGHHDKNVDNH